MKHLKQIQALELFGLFFPQLLTIFINLRDHACFREGETNPRWKLMKIPNHETPKVGTLFRKNKTCVFFPVHKNSTPKWWSWIYTPWNSKSIWKWMVGRWFISFWGSTLFSGVNFQNWPFQKTSLSGWCSTTPLLQPELLGSFRIGKMVLQPTNRGCQNGKLSTQNAEPSGHAWKLTNSPSFFFIGKILVPLGGTLAV